MKSEFVKSALEKMNVFDRPLSGFYSRARLYRSNAQRDMSKQNMVFPKNCDEGVEPTDKKRIW